jgi:hypothetical protein
MNVCTGSPIVLGVPVEGDLEVVRRSYATFWTDA